MHATAAFGLLVLLLVEQVWAAERIAFVVGISKYEKVGRLDQPVNDAEAIASRLKDLEFDVTLVPPNAKSADLLSALDRFVETHAPTAESGEAPGLMFFYFAGHGVEYTGDAGAKGNYLLSADSDPAQFPRSAIRLDDVVQKLRKLRRSNNVLVLDACREVKMRAFQPQEALPAMGARLDFRGARNFLVQYATAYDERTADKGRFEHGPFTGELLQQLGKPGLSLQDTFALTTGEVQKRYQLSPFHEGSLGEVIVLQPETRVPLQSLLITALLTALIWLGWFIWQRRRGALVLRLYDPHRQIVVAECQLGQRVLIGRGASPGPERKVLFDDPSVSKRHAQVGLDANGPWVEDLESTEGTWFGPGRRLAPNVRHRLSHSQVFWLSQRLQPLRVDLVRVPVGMLSDSSVASV